MSSPHAKPPRRREGRRKNTELSLRSRTGGRSNPIRMPGAGWGWIYLTLSRQDAETEGGKTHSCHCWHTDCHCPDASGCTTSFMFFRIEAISFVCPLQAGMRFVVFGIASLAGSFAMTVFWGKGQWRFWTVFPLSLDIYYSLLDICFFIVVMV